jgi:hypothetical protein
MNDPLTHDERVRLTQDAFRLLAAWDIPKQRHPELLGIDPALRKRQVNRYRLGTPLPDDRDSYQRIVLLFRIHNTLRKLFPHSEMSANLWVTTPNPSYGGLTPLDTMLRRGLLGIQRVEHSLNAMDGW